MGSEAAGSLRGNSHLDIETRLRHSVWLWKWRQLQPSFCCSVKGTVVSNDAKWRLGWGGVALLGVLFMAGPLWQIPFDLLIYDSAGEYRSYGHHPAIPTSMDSFKWWLTESWFIGIPMVLVGLGACGYSYLVPGSLPPSKFRFQRLIAAVISMLLCAGLAFIVPPLWAGASGRDLRPRATTLALLVFVLAIVFRRGLQWDFWDFLWAALGADFVTLLIISSFSGFTWLRLFHSFNLYWLLFMSAFTIVPWFLGFALGSAWQWRRAGPFCTVRTSAAPTGGPSNTGNKERPPSVS